MNTRENSDEFFYAVIDRMKAQGALAHESFLKEIPFFIFSAISKEAQVKELFHDICNPQNYKNVLNTIAALTQDSNVAQAMGKSFSPLQMMNFAQLVLYKTLPCPDDTECPHRPREIATHNQYKDHEYHCPFYHHDRDQRRLVITPEVDSEFAYKANYFEEGRKNIEKDKYSQNYFESMFHPLYYKMFRCKREYCSSSPMCPFYHSEEEKHHWDEAFSNFVRKDRITYVKDKKKYFENPPVNRNQNREHVIRRAETMDEPSKVNNWKRENQGQRKNVATSEAFNNSPNQNLYNGAKDWNPLRNKMSEAWRKDSNDSLEEFQPYGFLNYSGSQLPISRNS